MNIFIDLVKNLIDSFTKKPKLKVVAPTGETKPQALKQPTIDSTSKPIVATIPETKAPKALFAFDRTCSSRLATCHPDIQKVMNEVIKYYSFYVIEGNRTKQKQDEAYNKGASKVRYPNSYHNYLPSLAIDIAPYKDGKIIWNDHKAFEEMAEVVKREAAKLNVPLDWGYDLWKWDAVHFQLTSYKK